MVMIYPFIPFGKRKTSYHIKNANKLTNQDTSLNIGSNNVASDIKVDPDEFTLREKWGEIFKLLDSQHN